jgi:AraC family transcriptional regulator of adaptative response/methylated-DNA-[protein]-cysteine methyltransferase
MKDLDDETQSAIDAGGQWALDYRRIDQAIRFVNENYLRHPSLDEVAAHVHLSPFHFERLFQRWAGTSPKRFMQFLTVRHARELLRQSRSVLETSHLSGLSGSGRLHDLFVTREAVTPGEWKSGGQGVTIRHGCHQTAFGECFLAMTDRGICDLRFLGDAESKSTTESPTEPTLVRESELTLALEELRREWPCARFEANQAMTGEVARRLFSHSPEQRPRFHLHIRGTNFQIQVWEALMQIPTGSLVTYSQLAAAVGHPQAQRAVGTAVGRNPVAFLIPCHRVIQRMGGFGNYRWGAIRKQALIGWESALPPMDDLRA